MDYNTDPLENIFRRSPFKFANTEVSSAGLGDSPSPTNDADGWIGKDGNEYYEYIELSQGISQGRLEVVKDFLNHRPDAVDKWITLYETPLLKACAFGNPDIAKEILCRMTPEQMLPTVPKMVKENDLYHTPLTLVAASGNMEIAEALVAKNPKLLEIPGIKGQIPVVVAVENTQMEMALYLYTRTPIQVLIDQDGYHASCLFLYAIFYKMPGFALDLFNMNRRLAVTKNSKIWSIPITALASEPDLFPGGCYLGPLKRLIYSCPC